MVNLSVGLVLSMALVGQAQVLVDPGERTCVKGEELKISGDAPKAYQAGTVLRTMAMGTNGRIPAPGALDVGSFVIRKGELRLEEGKDFLLDHEWGTFGVAAGGRVKPDDVVAVDYCFALRRLDSVVRMAHGKETVVKGVSRLTRPEPPAIPTGATRVANVYVPYFSDGVKVDVFPIAESAAQAVTGTLKGRIPRTMAKLKAGKPVKVVAWGDSVTAGGDATTPETRYPSVLEQMLKERFPAAQVQVETVAVGGTHSRQWLYPEKYPHRLAELARQIRWERVTEAKPDVVTIEFVNDAGLKPEDVQLVYGDILKRLGSIGAEVILITPHFTRMPMMKFASLREKESRPYVLALREFARANGVGLADAAARWEHLWKEGIPYETLLNNGINHPDDRGHRLFAEELIRCFE